jgi:hypothetical protein
LSLYSDTKPVYFIEYDLWIKWNQSGLLKSAFTQLYSEGFVGESLEEGKEVSL